MKKIETSFPEMSSKISSGGNNEKKEKNRWTILNPNNKYVTVDNIKNILQKGNITIPFKDLSIWQKSFVHKSYLQKAESGSDSDTPSPKSSPKSSPINSQEIIPLQENSNERLEWLGDAQLQASVTQYLFKRYPDKDEGFLTQLRSKLVKTENLSFLAKKLGLDNYIIISHHVEFGCQGRMNKRILENTFEAFVGAMYIDYSNLTEIPNYAFGSEVVRRFVIKIIENYVDLAEMVMKNDNYKDSLMWYFQKNFKGAYPKYNKEKFENDYFYVYVKEPITEKIVGRGTGKTKKQAEQNAANNALQYYSVLE